MHIGGRCGTGGADPRYKFTGKERDVESQYDYFGARYYDARIGRFSGVDRFASKYPSFSPFSYGAGNPLRFIDVNGDSLDTGQNRALSLSYLQCLHPELLARLSVSENGRVAFDTKDLDLSSDASLQLMNSMVNGNDLYLFEVCDNTTGILRENTTLGTKGDVVSIDLTRTDGTGIANLSVTPFLETGPGGLLPRSGYQGQVSLGKGSWSELSIPSVVFHELSENLHRTTSPGMPYAKYRDAAGRDLGGAHERAILNASRFNLQQGDLWKGNRYVP